VAEVWKRARPLAVPGVEDLVPVARGGFATVYRGWQPSFHRQVAVKVLDASAPAADRFPRELKAMGALSEHPNVVSVYEAGVVDGSPYLVMPWLAEGSLEDELRRGPLASTDVVSLGERMADALAAAHAIGLLHRDVKPANILRNSYGAPLLTDFGIARFADATATQGQILTTVGYAAPEILSGEPATERSDVYSLGATLHAALGGKAPFAPRPDEAPIAMAVRVLNDAPERLPRAVPRELQSVVERAMAKDPAQRFPTAAELGSALGHLNGAPVAAQPSTPGGQVSRSVPRRTAIGWIAVAALVAVIAVMLFALVRGWSDSRNAGSSTTVSSVGSTAAPAAAPTAAAIATAVPQYYAILSNHQIDQGFAWLSPAYQARTGIDSYRGFWQTIAGVEVLSVEPGDRSARVTLRYTRSDGSTSTENATLRFVTDASGRLLIDDYRLG
jgi:serine/threonine protein kinase